MFSYLSWLALKLEPMNLDIGQKGEERILMLLCLLLFQFRKENRQVHFVSCFAMDVLKLIDFSVCGSVNLMVDSSPC